MIDYLIDAVPYLSDAMLGELLDGRKKDGELKTCGLEKGNIRTCRCFE
jgi:hypothetical protein